MKIIDSDSQGQTEIKAESDMVAVRKIVRERAQTLGFSMTEVTKVVTAASELARNIYRYADKGIMKWYLLRRDSQQGLELEFVDNGPGIDNVELAMSPGFSTAKGLGLGLSGAKRLMDEMELDSRSGQGTRVVIRKWVSNAR